jgi:kumamolisin
MSRSEPPPHKLPITCHAAEGVQVTLFDGKGEILYRGGPGTLELAVGLYLVRAELADAFKDQVVILDAPKDIGDVTPLRETAAPLRGAREIPPVSYSEISGRETKTNTAPGPIGIGPNPESRLVLFVRAIRPGLEPGRVLARGLQLLDTSAAIILDFNSAGKHIRSSDTEGWLTFSADAVPGLYILRCSGEQPRDLPIHLYPGWETQVFVVCQKRPLLEGAKIFMAPKGLGFQSDDEIATAVDLGTDCLQNGFAFPPKPIFASLLEGKFDNPMLGLIGAHALLRQDPPDRERIWKMLGDLRRLLPGSLDVRALEVRAAQRLDEPVDGDTVMQVPMIRAGLEYLIAASDVEGLIPGDSLVSRVAPRAYADSFWSSWQSMDFRKRTDGGEELLELGHPARFFDWITRHPALKIQVEDWVKASTLKAVLSAMRARRQPDPNAIAFELGLTIPNIIQSLLVLASEPRQLLGLAQSFELSEAMVDRISDTVQGMIVNIAGGMEQIVGAVGLRGEIPLEIISLAESRRVTWSRPRRPRRVDVVLRGSERERWAGAIDQGPVPPHLEFRVTIRLRARTRLPPLPAWAGGSMRRDEVEKVLGSAPDDLQRVEIFARRHGLDIAESSPVKRSVVLSGTVANLEEAFSVELNRYHLPEFAYRGYIGVVKVPAEMEGIVQGVFGLDNRPFARPHARLSEGDRSIGLAAARSTRTFYPSEIARLYNFPEGFDGRGQCIGIIEPGGCYRSQDLTDYFGSLGIRSPAIHPVFVNGAAESPGFAEAQVALDIQVAGGVAPGASIVVYLAPDASEQSFLDAITAAVHDRVHQPSVISISWGGPEMAATEMFRQQFDEVLHEAAVLGITVCVASGDNGAAGVGPGDWDGVAHVGFPASSPFALACGGTHLLASNGTIESETVWNEGPVGAIDPGRAGHSFGASGGGVSRYFPLPDWQQLADIPPSIKTGQYGRGVPDVAGNAIGYNTLLNVDGERRIVPLTGTGAVAPLWAGLIARINQAIGRRLGYLNPILYHPQQVDAFRNITIGNNVVGGAEIGYHAGQGWDACTGLGAPDGAKLLAALQGRHST